MRFTVRMVMMVTANLNNLRYMIVIFLTKIIIILNPAANAEFENYSKIRLDKVEKLITRNIVIYTFTKDKCKLVENKPK